MSGQVIRAKWHRHLDRLPYVMGLQVEGVAVSQVFQLMDHRWVAFPAKRMGSIQAANKAEAMRLCEDAAQEWLADISPWPVEFDRSEVTP